MISEIRNDAYFPTRKTLVFQENITYMYIYQKTVTICEKQTLTKLKREITNLKIKVGDFNTPINNG